MPMSGGTTISHNRKNGSAISLSLSRVMPGTVGGLLRRSSRGLVGLYLSRLGQSRRAAAEPPWHPVRTGGVGIVLLRLVQQRGHRLAQRGVGPRDVLVGPQRR